MSAPKELHGTRAEGARFAALSESEQQSVCHILMRDDCRTTVDGALALIAAGDTGIAVDRPKPTPNDLSDEELTIKFGPSS